MGTRAHHKSSQSFRSAYRAGMIRLDGMEFTSSLQLVSEEDTYDSDTWDSIDYARI
jgi:hypothetical protein